MRSQYKYIKRELLAHLPDIAIKLINEGQCTLFEIEPKKLNGSKEIFYLLRLDKTEFRYLDLSGLPLHERPKNIEELKIIACIRFENFQCNTNPFNKNLLLMN
jgi:hypothetical protein